MRRLMLRKIHFSLALAIIVVVGLAFGGLVAYRSVQAYGLNVGGRIVYVGNCVIENPVFEPNVCHTCPNCTGLLQSACEGYNEIRFRPSGGTPGQNYICMRKGYRYRGGGNLPRIGAWLLAVMLSPFIPVQVGISR